jgi:hypothetical protein
MHDNKVRLQVQNILPTRADMVWYLTKVPDQSNKRSLTTCYRVPSQSASRAIVGPTKSPYVWSTSHAAISPTKSYQNLIQEIQCPVSAIFWMIRVLR